MLQLPAFLCKNMQDPRSPKPKPQVLWQGKVIWYVFGSPNICSFSWLRETKPNWTEIYNFITLSVPHHFHIYINGFFSFPVSIFYPDSERFLAFWPFGSLAFFRLSLARFIELIAPMAAARHLRSQFLTFIGLFPPLLGLLRHFFFLRIGHDTQTYIEMSAWSVKLNLINSIYV